MRLRSTAARDIRTIHQGLASVVAALARLIPLVERASTNEQAAKPPTRKLTLSPERRAALKLQGEYIGHLRGLRPRQKAEVKALRAAKGLAQAARLAKKLASGNR